MGEKETVIQKFNRLKCELVELEQEMAQTKVLKNNLLNKFLRFF